ncbi:mannose-6-phosphate isomerase-like protein (cupin superfamily) [Methanocalculus alkaliphilus]|uniref:cupin domain-containing protein n=1 Tax=Methanocalculus alkaliphilus TaxID=768730 RepID=UPI00209D4EC4|nr:cupin domain-containing protein [Methanocalculus alkaliphilus]MCP1716227.1 mannose-6-phosphate isomerase-like protein (cupin superfamily) [Methanocalculus alkaliphilus]
MKKGFAADIETDTVQNTDFRRVLYTGKYSQLVLMSLKPGEEIGSEVHDDIDQFFRFEQGEGKVVIDGVEHMVKDGTAVVVPSGAEHNVVNTSATEDLRLYTVYAPPEHIDGTIHKTKAEADAAHEHFDGKTTE